MSDELVESIITMNGELRIDLLNGLVTFNDGWGRTILRVSHLREPVPNNVMIDIVSLPNLTSYTPLQQPDQHVESFQEWIDESEINPAEEDHCPVCTKVHTSADYAKWGTYTFIVSHEYIIWTRNSMQTYAHRGRMQYLGQGSSSFRYQLIFNARGPDRSTKGNFGGTQTLDARNIVKLEEVDRDPSKRYVDEIDRDMPRERA